MPDSDIYLTLENYLEMTVEALSAWGDWLAEHERRVIEGDVRLLEAHAPSAEQLHNELARLNERRAEVLASARRAGFTCSTLKQLAQALPEWHTRLGFRQRVRNVERCMSNLHRLSTAAWLLVSQCSRVVDDTLMLMTVGSALRSVYVDVPHADTSGGQIFDTRA